MNKSILKISQLLLMFILFASGATAQREPWNDMSVYRINKEPAHAFCVTYPDMKSAQEKMDMLNPYENSSSYKSLNGTWKFKFVDKHADRIKGFANDGFNFTDWKDIKVPMSWQLAGYDNIWYTNDQLGLFFDEKGKRLPEWTPGTPEFTQGTLPDPRMDKLWRFPVGYYRRAFTVSNDWKDKQIILHFAGVQSGFDLYVNGHYVGYSEDSFTPAEFDVTKYLREGENTVSLEVYRWPTGALFEMQDMPQLAGIHRDVMLIARPKVQLLDFYVAQSLSSDLKTATLVVETSVRNTSEQSTSGKIEMFMVEGDDKIVAGKPIATFAYNNIAAGQLAVLKTNTVIDRLKLWSPDQPNLYQVLFKITDSSGKTLEVNRADYAFRRFEIRGKELFLNNVRLLLKGTNRHDTDPLGGKALDPKWYLIDAQLMKQLNINAVRTSHYPNDNRWYLTCNRLGLLVLDEANLETHGLSRELPMNVEIYIAPGVDRMVNMVMRDRNQPCVVIWSVGNESGNVHHKTHEAMAQIAKKLDPSRGIHSQGQTQNVDNLNVFRQNEPAIIDFVSPMYGEDRLAEAYLELKEERRPFFYCEYAHSMGNSTGDLKYYWDYFRENKSKGLNGGFIWDWVDQSYKREVPGQSNKFFWTDARDYNTFPNAANFCSNGITNAERTMTDKAYEVKIAYQDLQIDPVDLAKSQFAITNEYISTNSNAFKFSYTIEEDGKLVAHGQLPAPEVGAGESKTVTLKLPDVQPVTAGSELYLTLKFSTKTDNRWSKAGQVVASAQFRLPVVSKPAQPKTIGKGELKIDETANSVKISNDKVQLTFDKKIAQLTNYSIDGVSLIEEGPKLEYQNAPIDNHKGMIGRSIVRRLQKDESKLEVFESTPRQVRIALTNSVKSDSTGLREKQVWTILPDGTAHVAVQIIKLNKTGKKTYFPLLGVSMRLNERLSSMEWLGCGPFDNYPDRKVAAFIGRYTKPVAETYNHYFSFPQDHGNKESVRWMAFGGDKKTPGLLIVNDVPQPVAVLPYTQEQLRNVRHDYELPSSTGAIVRVCQDVCGLGNSSCGPQPRNIFLIDFEGSVEYGFRFQPLQPGDDAGLRDREILYAKIPYRFEHLTKNLVDSGSIGERR